MAFKLVVLCCALAAANAGLLGAPVAYSAAPAVSHVSYSSPLVSYGAPTLSVAAPALTTQHQNILRSPGNLQQISTYSKTIDTPFSSVSKSDVRVSNPGLVATTSYAAPALSYAAAPVLTKAYAAPALGYAAAPALGYAAAPALRYAAAPVLTKAYAAPALGYAAAPALGYAAAPAVHATYSASPAVSHMTYSNGLGVSYGW